MVVLQNHCRVITLDLRGFGRSDAPQGPYSMPQMAADVRALMSALDINRAVFVGHLDGRLHLPLDLSRIS